MSARLVTALCLLVIVLTPDVRGDARPRAVRAPVTVRSTPQAASVLPAAPVAAEAVLRAPGRALPSLLPADGPLPPGVVMAAGEPMLCTGREAGHRGRAAHQRAVGVPGRSDRGQRSLRARRAGPWRGDLAGGRAGCSTVQRAFTTYRLFERLGRAPHLLLSGRGPRWPARRLDAAELRCASERLAEEGAGSAGLTRRPRSVVRAEARELARTARTSLSGKPELMCAVILRQYPRRSGTRSRRA